MYQFFVQDQIKMSYVCEKCKISGCKLWRGYNKNGSVGILCILCKENNKKYIPAVPVSKKGGGYWGYTSIPQKSIKWWKQLPVVK